MDETLWGMMNIIGPAILLALLLWLVVRSRRGKRSEVERTEQATHNNYADEEQRRRDGTDGL